MHEDFRNYVEELLANRPCPIDTWIHLRNCPKCSQELETLQKVSRLFPDIPFERVEPDPLFYTRVQARIERLRWQSPWHVFPDTGLAKRLVLACLACTGLLAAYLFGVSSENSTAQPLSRPADLTSPELADRETQRNAVLVNFVVDSKPVYDADR
jgi:hypothetical protein